MAILMEAPALDCLDMVLQEVVALYYLDMDLQVVDL